MAAISDEIVVTTDDGSYGHPKLTIQAGIDAAVGQGLRGTCVAWAYAYAAKSCLEAEERGDDPWLTGLRLKPLPHARAD